MKNEYTYIVHCKDRIFVRMNEWHLARICQVEKFYIQKCKIMDEFISRPLQFVVESFLFVTTNCTQTVFKNYLNVLR